MKAENIYVHDVNVDRLEYMAKKYGIKTATDVNDILNHDLMVGLNRVDQLTKSFLNIDFGMQTSKCSRYLREYQSCAQ